MTDPGAPESETGEPHRFRTLRGVAGAAVLIGAITAAARVAGFGRTVVFSQTVTTSCLSQAYYTANQIPNVVFEIVAGGALASMVVPVLAGPAGRGDREHVQRVCGALLTWVILILVPLSSLAVIAAGPIMELLVRGDLGGCVRSDVISVGTDMLRVFAPQIALYGLAVVIYGIVQAHRRFTGPALAPLVSSLLVAGAYLAYVPLGNGRPNDLARLPEAAELVLAVGTTLGVVALVVTAAVAALRLRLRLRPTLSFPPGVAAQVRRLALAGLATVAAQQLATLAVVILSGWGTRGALTDYSYAWAVFLLPWAILTVPIATSAFPVLSARTSDGDAAAFDRVTAATTRAVILVCCAGTAVLIAAAVPTAHFFDNGPQTQPVVLARAIVAFAPGLIGYGLVAHLGRVLYAGHRGRAAAGCTVAGWLVVIAADIALVGYVPRDWVVGALGIGNTIGMTLAGGALVVALLRARGRGALAGVVRAGLAGLVGAAAGAVAGYAVAGYAAAGSSASPTLAIGVAALAATVAGVVFFLVVSLIDGRDLRTVLSRRLT